MSTTSNPIGTSVSDQAIFLQTLTMEIAKHLDGATYRKRQPKVKDQQREAHEASQFAYIDFADGRSLLVYPQDHSWQHEKLTVAGLYPGNRLPKECLSPSEVEAYRDRIGCTAHKEAKKIAKDIERRLMPGYEYLFGKVQKMIERANQYDRYVRETTEALHAIGVKGSEICHPFGRKDDLPYLHLRMRSQRGKQLGTYGDIRVTGTDSVHMDLNNLSVAETRDILEVLAKHRK